MYVARFGLSTSCATNTPFVVRIISCASAALFETSTVTAYMPALAHVQATAAFQRKTYRIWSHPASSGHFPLLLHMRHGSALSSQAQHTWWSNLYRHMCPHAHTSILPTVPPLVTTNTHNTSPVLITCGLIAAFASCICCMSHLPCTLVHQGRSDSISPLGNALNTCDRIRTYL